MRPRSLACLVLAIVLVVEAGPAAALPPPPTAPFTLWNFLGIPQGFNKWRDGAFNKRGNHPGLERSPPLKAIADPENLKSENPAIKAAAEVKTEEDLAPQKIKALKYLSTIGCDTKNYPQVQEALVASLEDPTEEVRYQAVLAIQDAITQYCQARNESRRERRKRRDRSPNAAAENCACTECGAECAEGCQDGKCDSCDTACCCNEDVVKALSKLAWERDDKGCFLEPSERVREAAKTVACACCPNRGPIMETVEPEEVPQPAPVPEGEGLPTPPPGPEGAAPEEPAPEPPAVPEPTVDRRVPRRAAIAAQAGHRRSTAARDFESPTQFIMPGGAARTTQQRAPLEAVAVERTTGDGWAMPPLPRALPPRAMPPHPTATPASFDSSPSSAASPAAGAGAENSARANAPPRRAASIAAPRRRETLATSRLLWGVPSAAQADYQVDNTMLAPKFGPQARSSKPRLTVRATVARVAADEGIVELSLPAGAALVVGDRLLVSHRYLLQVATLGEIEVVASDSHGVLARPVAPLALGKVSRGDSATYEPPPSAPCGGQPALASSAKLR
jgi:hypothetical protein